MAVQNCQGSEYKSGAPRAKARGSSTCFVGRNPPKRTLLRSFGASKGTLLAFIHGLKTRGFLRRRVKLAQTAYNQSFIAEAPVVLVCCADIKGYLDGTVSGIQDLGRIKAVEDRIGKIILDRVGEMRSIPIEQVVSRITFNVAIAIEHIVLSALDFGLGTCWVRLIDEKRIKHLFGWDENIHVIALLPIGYPDESPSQRKRLRLGDILIE